MAQTVVFVSPQEKASGEKKGLLTFLSQGTVGGCLAGFAYLLVVSCFSWDARHLSAEWVYFPIILFISGFLGCSAGLCIWIAAQMLTRKPGIFLRILIATTVISLVPFGLCLLIMLMVLEPLWEGLLGSLAFGLVVGVPVAIITGTRIRPSHLLAFGTFPRGATSEVLFNHGPIRISRRNEEMRFAFLTGLPLRAASLFGFLASLLAVAGVSSYLSTNADRVESPEDFYWPLIAAIYFATSLFISFAILEKRLVIVTSLVVNILVAAWVFMMFDLESNIYPIATTSSILLGLWLLFMTGRMLFERKGPLEVEYGHTEIRFGKAQWVKEAI